MCIISIIEFAFEGVKYQSNQEKYLETLSHLYLMMDNYSFKLKREER